MSVLTQEEREIQVLVVRRKRDLKTHRILSVTVLIKNRGSMRFNEFGKVIFRRPSDLTLPQFLFQRARNLALRELGLIESQTAVLEDPEVDSEESRPRTLWGHYCVHCSCPIADDGNICPNCDQVWYHQGAAL